MCLSDTDQLLVVAPQSVIARKARARQHVSGAPGHVAAIVGPFAAQTTDFLTVVDDRDARGGEEQHRRQAEEGHVPLELEKSAGRVVGGEVMRNQVPGPDFLSHFQVPVERHGPAAALHEAQDVALEAEVEAGVHLVWLEPGLEHLGVCAKDLAKQEELRTQLGAGALAMLLPEGMVDVLDGVQPEAVDPRALRPGDLRIEQELRDFRLLSLEVGQPGEAAGEVVLSTIADDGGAQPLPGLRVAKVARVVPGMVVDDVEQDLDPPAWQASTSLRRSSSVPKRGSRLLKSSAQ